MLLLKQRAIFSPVFGKTKVFFEHIIIPEAKRIGNRESETIRIGRDQIPYFMSILQPPKDELTLLAFRLTVNDSCR